MHTGCCMRAKGGLLPCRGKVWSLWRVHSLVTPHSILLLPCRLCPASAACHCRSAPCGSATTWLPMTSTSSSPLATRRGPSVSRRRVLDAKSGIGEPGADKGVRKLQGLNIGDAGFEHWGAWGLGSLGRCWQLAVGHLQRRTGGSGARSQGFEVWSPGPGPMRSRIGDTGHGVNHWQLGVACRCRAGGGRRQG